MNTLQLQAASTTMTSREISELTGKRHDHVMRDVQAMLVQLESTGPSFGGSYTDPTGRTLPMFKLPKRETLILVSGYSVAMRAKIIDRWQELEAAQQTPALPNFGNPAEAARAWALQYEQTQQAQAQLAITSQALAVAEPKARALELLIHDSKRSVTSIARQLPGVNSRTIKKDLQWKYLYKSGGQWRVYRNGHADKFFYEGPSDAFGKWDIFCTEAGQVELVRLAQLGALTRKAV